MSARTVQVGGETLTVEEFSGRKAAWALTLLRYIGKGAPEITGKWSDFVRDYEQRNVIELDRAQARYQLGDRVEHLTDADWDKAGNRLRLPRTPSVAEVAAHLFPDVLDLALQHVIRLLALLVTPNAECARRETEGSLAEHLESRGNQLLDTGLYDELIELVAVGGEVVSEQYTRRASELGERLGNGLRLFGINPSRQTPQEPDTTTTRSQETSSETSSSSSATSSTDSPAPTDGANDGSSTERAGASSPASSTA